MTLTAEGGTGHLDELEGLLHDAAGLLSRAHVTALIAHPEAVCPAPAVAADLLMAGERERRSGIERIAGYAVPATGAADAQRRIFARTREGSSETLLTSKEMAARTGLGTPPGRFVG